MGDPRGDRLCYLCREPLGREMKSVRVQGVGTAGRVRVASARDLIYELYMLFFRPGRPTGISTADPAVVPAVQAEKLYLTAWTHYMAGQRQHYLLAPSLVGFHVCRWPHERY